MARLTPEQSINLKEIVLHYLRGESLSVTRVRLQVESADLGSGCKYLYKSILLRKNGEDPLISAILGSLNIKKSSSEETAGYYEKLLKKSDTLYDLLFNLSHDGYHHVNYLLQLIETTKPRRNWTLMFMTAALGSAAIGTFSYIYRNYLEAFGDWLVRSFPTFIGWAGRTFSLLRNIPLIGIIYNGIGLIWSWYHTFANGTTTTGEKLKDLVFKTFTAGLTISAYLLSYLAGGIMTVPIAMLFVLSSATDVLQSLYDYTKSSRALKNLAPPTEGADWESCAEYERAKNLHGHTLKTFGVKIAAAILTTVAVGIWCFFPPSLVITVSCIAFMSLTALAKWSMLKTFEETSANNLQRKLRSIDLPFAPELSEDNQVSLERLGRGYRTLHQREAQLAMREQELTIREAALRTAMETFSSPARMTVLLQDGSSQVVAPAPAIDMSGLPPASTAATIATAPPPPSNDGEEEEPHALMTSTRKFSSS